MDSKLLRRWAPPRLWGAREFLSPSQVLTCPTHMPLTNCTRPSERQDECLGMIDLVLVLQHQAPLVQTADAMRGLTSALAATAAGLIVGIPCYVAFNLLVVKIDRLVLDMDRAISDIMAFYADMPDKSEQKILKND